MELEPLGVPAPVYKRKEALPLLYRPAVLILGAIVGLCIIGMIALPIMGVSETAGLIAIGSIAVKALADTLTQESRTDAQ